MIKIKKIVYIITDISIIGGREKIVLEKANFLSNKGYNVSIISYKLENNNIKKKYPNINFISLRYELYFVTHKHTLLQKFLFLKDLKIKLQRQIDRLNPNIIIGLCDSGMGEYLKIKTTAKKILEIHGCYDYYYDSIKNSFNLKKIKNFFWFYIFLKKVKKYDKIIILSEIDRKKWNIKRIEVIPNFCMEVENGKIDNYFKEKRFLSAGRITSEKGFDILVNIWKEVIKFNKEIKIDVFGEGSDKEKVISLIKENNLQKNIFIYPFTDKLNREYKKYYGYVLPSRYESFPMVVLESMYNGVPVIAFDIECGIKDMITSYKEGILIEKYNVKRMAEKIIELYNLEKLREKMSKNSIKKAENYNIDKIMTKWMRLFLELEEKKNEDIDM